MSAVDDTGSIIPFSKDMRSWCADSEVSVNSIGSGFWTPFLLVPVGIDISELHLENVLCQMSLLSLVWALTVAVIGYVVFGIRRLEAQKRRLPGPFVECSDFVGPFDLSALVPYCSAVLANQSRNEKQN